MFNCRLYYFRKNCFEINDEISFTRKNVPKNYRFLEVKNGIIVFSSQNYTVWFY